jgi:hypothetical protein
MASNSFHLRMRLVKGQVIIIIRQAYCAWDLTEVKQKVTDM